MKVNEITIDLVAIVTCILALWLGVTGRVDWWIVILVFLLQSRLKFTIRR